MKPKLRNRVLTALLSLALLAGLMPGCAWRPLRRKMKNRCK